ncbi:MAG TPA: hypothetical protein VFB25_03650 [Gaiellaceae bacterium]|nr:hypothetical protein [Gaiellaceae bacterium]
MSAKCAALRDPELVELLRDEPELLAIADAIAASPRPRRLRLARHTATVIVASLIAGVAIAGALARSDLWLFSTTPYHQTVGAAQVRFHGGVWNVSVTIFQGDRTFALQLLNGRGQTVMSTWGESLLAVKGLPQKLLPHPPAPTGPPFGALWVDEAGGQIWFGDARPEVTAIAITDDHGRVFTTKTAAPGGMTTAFRLWIVALPHSSAVSIAAYDRDGKLVGRHYPYGLGPALHLH